MKVKEYLEVNNLGKYIIIADEEKEYTRGEILTSSLAHEEVYEIKHLIINREIKTIITIEGGY